MKRSDKNVLLDKLSVCYNRVNYLKTLCEERKDLESAAKFERRRARLQNEIDWLLRDIYQDWIGESEELKEKLDEANSSVEKAVEDIEKKVKLAGNITKAIGYIDDVVKIATDLVV